MASIAGFPSAVLSKLGMEVPYAPRRVSSAWVLAVWAGLGYGGFLTVLALRTPPGVGLTGHSILQPPFKVSMAVLLAVAATRHPILRERRWLVPALLMSAVGDWLLEIPWWTESFGLGLAAFLLAHLCYLAVLLPLIPRARPSNPRLASLVLICLTVICLLVWLWPSLDRDKLTIPVAAYISVLIAMVCAAQVARLPTILTAVGALSFAASDAMIAIGRFILENDDLQLPIWWLYAIGQILITAGFFFGRETPGDAAFAGDGEVVDWPAEGSD